MGAGSISLIRSARRWNLYPEGELGTGDYGRVEQVRDYATGRRYAMKTFVGNPSLSEVLNEYHLTNFLSQWIPVPKVYEVVGITSDPEMGDRSVNKFYLLMEIMPGVTIDKFIRDRGDIPVPPEEALDLLWPLVLIVKKMRDLNVVHGDIHSSNVLVHFDPQTTEPWISLLDFGRACAVVPLDDYDDMKPHQYNLCDFENADANNLDVQGLARVMTKLVTSRSARAIFPGERWSSSTNDDDEETKEEKSWERFEGILGQSSRALSDVLRKAYKKQLSLTEFMTEIVPAVDKISMSTGHGSQKRSKKAI